MVRQTKVNGFNQEMESGIGWHVVNEKVRGKDTEKKKQRKVVVVAAATWSLKDSVWRPRMDQCESVGFYDTVSTMRHAFDKDWRRVLRKSQFRKLISRVCHNDEHEINEVRDEVFQDYATIMCCFHFYAACSSGTRE